MEKSINKKPKLKLINYKGTSGYAMSNIKEVFDKKEFENFQDWIDGQTVMLFLLTCCLSRSNAKSFLLSGTIR